MAHDDDSQDPNFAFTLHQEDLVVICLRQVRNEKILKDHIPMINHD